MSSLFSTRWMSVALVALLCILASAVPAVTPADPATIPTTRDESRAHRHPTIEALLRDAGSDTVVVLHNVWRGTMPLTGQRAERARSTAKLLEYAQAHGARVLVLTHGKQGEAGIPKRRQLPSELRAAIEPARRIAQLGLSPWAPGSTRVLRRELANGKTIIEQHLAGARNLLIIGGENDFYGVVPKFEGVWAGFNVYSNPLLDIRMADPDSSTHYLEYFEKRLDGIEPNQSEPLALPGFLAEDPFMHIVPIGAIPGVVDRWDPPANSTWGRVRSDGTQVPHIAHDDPPVPNGGFSGLSRLQNPFDLQVHVVLGDEALEDQPRHEHMVNRERSALVLLEEDRLRNFMQRTSGSPTNAQMADAFHETGLNENGRGELKFDVATRFTAYDHGRVEIAIHGHGGRTWADPKFRVGGLLPHQAGTVIVEHDHIGLNGRNANDRGTVAHLNILACGRRCNPDADATTGLGEEVGTDEVDWAKQLVRWLRDNHIDVQRVTVANASIASAENYLGQPSSVWFYLRDRQGKTTYMVRESALLATSLRYDRTSDAFLPADNEVLGDALPVGRSEPVRAADHRDIDTSAGEAATENIGGTADLMHVGDTLRTRSGATVEIVPAGDVRPRFDEPVSTSRDQLWNVSNAAVSKPDGSLEPDLMISGADTFAIAMGMRVQDGPVVVVDTDPARMTGVQSVLVLALDASTPLEWANEVVAEGLAQHIHDIAAFLKPLAERPFDSSVEGLADPGIVAAFGRLQARMRNDHYTFAGTDLATADGGAVVNALIGAYPVRSIALPSDEHFLVQGARLGMRVSRTSYLAQLHENIALLAGPETHIHQGVFGQPPRALFGEQAVRDFFELPGAKPLAAASGSSTPPPSIDGGSLDREIFDDVLNTVREVPGARAEVDAIEADLRDDHTPLHRWWTSMRERLGSVGAWLRRTLMALLGRLGVVHPSEAQTPAAAQAATAEDPLSLRIEGEDLGRTYSAATRRDLAAAGLSPHDWIPVLATARTEEERATPCALSTPCVRTEDRDYDVQFAHEGTGEVRTLTVGDPVYARTRQFMERLHEEAKVRAASPPVEGAHASTMNTAFALMGLLHVLESQRDPKEPDGLPENLATSLQVQMYLGAAQIGVGVADDVSQVARLVGEAVDVARQVEATVAVDATLATRVVGMSGRVLGPLGALLSGAMIGVDAYNLANAQTDAQRATFGTQLGTDVAFAAVMTGAFVAEAAGAATASAVIAELAAPLAGIAIGVVGLVEAFMEVAADVDAVAAKFDKFGDLYPRHKWTWEEVKDGKGDPQTRTHFLFKDDALVPVHGVAVSVVDLTRTTSGRYSWTAESFVESFDWDTMMGSFGGGINDDLVTVTAGNQPAPCNTCPLVNITQRAGIPKSAPIPMDIAKLLVLPATPASYFDGYEFTNLITATTRCSHPEWNLIWWWPKDGCLGYAVLRRIKSNDRYHGPFLFDFFLRAQETGMRRIAEKWLSTPVTVTLDEHVTTVALPAFAAPKNNGWTDTQVKQYRDAMADRTRHMSYTIWPHDTQAEPMMVQLQNDFGEILLHSSDAGPAKVWVLDARHLRNPDSVSLSMAARASGSTLEHGIVSIDGLTIRIAGAIGTKKDLAERDADVWVLMPHGAWHVDFAARKLNSVNLLAASDLVHGGKVKDAVLRQGFTFRTDGFIEIGVADGDPPHPVNGVDVKRYYESMRDENVVHALHDRFGDAVLVHGDESEALFHELGTGLVHRVRRGEVVPSASYHIGFGGSSPDYRIERVERADGSTHMLLVSYARKSPAWMVSAIDPLLRAAEDGTRMLVAYRMTPDRIEMAGLSSHNLLAAWLESKPSIANANVADARALVSELVGSFPVVGTQPGRLTPLVPQLADPLAVHGNVVDFRDPVSRVHWIDGMTVHKPLFVKPAEACRPGAFAEGASIRNVVKTTTCTLAYPNDVVRLGTYRAPASDAVDAPEATWIRYWSASLDAAFGYRPETSRTVLLAVGDGKQDRVAQDAAGVAWHYGGEGEATIAAVGPAFVDVTGAAWHKRLQALSLERDPDGKGGMIAIDGLVDPKQSAITAWYLPSKDAFVFAPANAAWVGGGDTTTVAYVRVGDELHEIVVIPASAVAAMFEGKQMRMPVSTREVGGRSMQGKLVSATARHDGACVGVQATYANGVVACLSSRARPKLLELEFCPESAPTTLDIIEFPDALNSSDIDYVPMTCTAANTTEKTRSGWYTDDGIVPAPKVAALKDADYRVLGFNADKQEAYFFVPATQLLYTTDWKGVEKRRTWLVDAQVDGNALFVKQPSVGIASGTIPLLDGIDELGLGSDGERAVRYRIDAAEREHYTRIVVDMGGTPLGTWQSHALELAYAGASKGDVRRWPGGWRVHHASSGRALELRGKPGRKTLVFLDANKALDLSTVRPVSFPFLPTGYAAPGAKDYFSDRHDIDDDGIADLVKLPIESFTGGSIGIEVAYRNADGSVRDTLRRADDKTWPARYNTAYKHGFYSVDGVTYYCGFATFAVDEVACASVDGDPTRFIGHKGYSATGTPPPPHDVDLGPWVRPLVQGRAFLSQAPQTQRLERFNGRTMECLADATGECVQVVPDTAYDLSIKPRDTQCVAGTPAAWCTAGLATVDPRHREGDWRNDGPVGQGLVWRINEGEVECASYDGRHCLWNSATLATMDRARLKPLRCGPAHSVQWGGEGYGIAAHWCEKLRPQAASEVGGWRDDGPVGDGLVWRKVDGDFECASYDGRHCLWSEATLSSLDHARLQPLRCGAQHTTQWGAPGYGNAAHWCERLRQGYTASTATATDTPPTLSNMRITGELRVGATLRGEYDYHDAEGDREGESRYQWYVSDPATGDAVAVDGAKGRTFTLRAQDRGDRTVWFNVERLRSASGTHRDAPDAVRSVTVNGEIVSSPPVAKNVQLTGAAVGQMLTASFVYEHPHGTAPGTHEFRFYRADADIPGMRTRFLTTRTTSTSAQYELLPTDAGYVMTVDVVPASSNPTDDLGDVVRSPQTPPIDPNNKYYGSSKITSIPDNSATWASDSIEVPEDGMIDGVTIDLEIHHTWIGDLEVTLMAPWGTTWTLHHQAGGSVDNLAISRRISFDGTRRDQKGTWRLSMRDVANADVGTLRRWGVKFR